MINPWKRFTAWLHYLRHPATIITMDEAHAKGVQINLTYTGEYSVIAKQVQEGMERARETKGRIVLDSDEISKHIDTNLLPAMQKRADEREKERNEALKQAMDWPYGERVNTLLETLIECGEHNRKLRESMDNEEDNDVPQEAKYGTIDYVDHCMNNLGMSLNFADPDGTLSSKGYKNDNEKQIWQAVLLDYRTLSDAIAALKKGQ